METAGPKPTGRRWLPAVSVAVVLGLLCLGLALKHYLGQDELELSSPAMVDSTLTQGEPSTAPEMPPELETDLVKTSNPQPDEHPSEHSFDPDDPISGAAADPGGVPPAPLPEQPRPVAESEFPRPIMEAAEPEDFQPAHTGMVKLTGDDLHVVLSRNGEQFELPGWLPPGTYDITAEFPSHGLRKAGQAHVIEGATITLHCSDSFGRCMQR